MKRRQFTNPATANRKRLAARYVPDGSGGERKAFPFEVSDDPDVRSDYYNDQFITPEVEEHGFIVLPISGDSTTTSFAYTIGLTGLAVAGREILLYGFYPDLGATLVKVVGDLIADSGKPGVAERVFTVDGIDIRLREPTQSEHARSIAGFASRHYDRRIVPLHMDVAGWPCPRCHPMVPDAECTCELNCWYRKCRHVDVSGKMSSVAD